ncbi:hypothetical protein PPROV_000673200 [Pycnococcus provasolii]|uniref:Uncharacterized protein n=1 Tax=Pycnococcus provasolii TaxID=41880 RepID=A0A830HQD8_9CHLO|nr:hypothetical protein PPROV_000673200 [Pycnococcus provasolii]
MATVASTSRRTSRPQPVVTRKRKQEGDDDPVAALVSQGIGGIEQFRTTSANNRRELFAPVCEQCGGQFTNDARTSAPKRRRCAGIIIVCGILSLAQLITFAAVSMLHISLVLYGLFRFAKVGMYVLASIAMLGLVGIWIWSAMHIRGAREV